MKRERDTLRGALTVASTYAAWGLLTIFWNLLTDVDSVFILAQRIVWSVVFMTVILLMLGRMGEIKSALRDQKMRRTCMICGVLITVNWGTYIWAVNNGHVLDASLGYFIEPVIVGLVGILAFREKPSKLEWVTFAFAAAGLLFMVIRSGTVPYLALVIAGSFAVYGAVKKNLPISAEASLFLETLFILLPALAFSAFAESRGVGGIGILHGWRWLLLPLCGVVTSLPLLFFNRGVKKIPYYLAGILMYINPTIQFIIGLTYFHEPLDRNRLFAFFFIWIGVLFTLADKLLVMRKTKENAV